MDDNFYRIEDELQRRKKQYESVKDKETPFRVEFRYKGSTAWEYFTNLEDARKANHSRCRYSIWGSPIIESPSSQQIQIQGPRGGWKKFVGKP